MGRTKAASDTPVLSSEISGITIMIGLIADTELKAILKGKNPPIRHLDLSGDLDRIDSPIQPCSVDLRIQEIFLPFEGDARSQQDVSAVKRTFSHCLGVGESVKVTTLEELDLNSEYAGLIVAPARLSRRGIIVPDVGHVDPGFSGKLRLTLINMGRSPYELKQNEPIVTVLLFRLASPVGIGLNSRQGGELPYETGLEDIRHLSSDLLNIELRASKRAEQVARSVLGDSGWRHAFFTWCLPIIIGLLTALVTYYATIESRLGKLETKTELFSGTRELEKRIQGLEERIKRVTTTPSSSRVVP